MCVLDVLCMGLLCLILLISGQLYKAFFGRTCRCAAAHAAHAAVLLEGMGGGSCAFDVREVGFRSNNSVNPALRLGRRMYIL
jgi:hypothetical protein